MMILRILAVALSFLGFCQAADFKVASLHPILGDMARQLGGDHVEVVDLLKPNGNLHSFQPSPRDMAMAAGSRLVIASGKNLEPYLSSLRDSFKNSTPPCEILDLGAKIPDVVISSNGVHEHDYEDDEEGCTCSDHGPNDPHWWQTPDNMKRAARQLYAAYVKVDPAHEQDYKKNLAVWNRKMDELDAWARAELVKIPENKSILAVGHAAMNHFCKDFGFKEYHVQGISREDEGDPSRLATLLQELRQAGIPAIFAEYGANPKGLEQIAKSLNVPLAGPIVTDGLAPDADTFETMFRKNVNAIVAALADKK